MRPQVAKYYWLDITVQDKWSCSKRENIWKCSIDVQPASSSNIYKVRFNQTVKTWDSNRGQAGYHFSLHTNSSDEKIVEGRHFITSNDESTFVSTVPNNLDGFVWPIKENDGSKCYPPITSSYGKLKKMFKDTGANIRNADRVLLRSKRQPPKG